MNYGFLAQDTPMAMATTSTSTVQPRQTFFQRFLPFFFPTPSYRFVDERPACTPVHVPTGTLGRDTNGNLTVNGNTYCQPPSYNIPHRNFAVPAYAPTRFRLF